MNLITYDWETHYNTKSKYSLGSMTPEEYVRNEQFQVILCSIKLDDGATVWKAASDDDFEDWLRSWPWETSAALAHNGAAFDHIVLGLHYDIHPELLLDTLQIARVKHGTTVGNSLAKLAKHYGLGEKGDEVVRANGLRLEDFTPQQLQDYGDYGVLDTDLCYGLFQELKSEFTTSQFIQGHLFARMASRPKLELDKEILERGYEQELERKATLTEDTADRLGVAPEGLPKVIRSNPKFAELLELLGAEVPRKISPTTGKETYAFAKTDQGLLDLQECGNELIESVVELRLGIKTSILETRLERFIGIAERGPSLPVFLRLHGAGVTGRASGCLVADTEINVYDPSLDQTMTKKIVDVMPDDLVWDGEYYVAHEGVVFSGFKEVIEHDGVQGTPNHKVFTERGTISLAEAKASRTLITTARVPETERVSCS